MTNGADPTPRPQDAPSGALADIGVLEGPGRRRRGVLWLAATVVATLTTGLLTIAVLLFLGVEGNPLVGSFVRDRIVLALQERIDPSLTLSIESVDLDRKDTGTTVRVAGFTVRDQDGRALVRAPGGHITLDTVSLFALRLVPTNVVLDRLSLAVEISESGEVRIAPSFAAADSPSTSAPDVTAVGQPLERLRELVGAAFTGLAATREAVGGRLPALGINRAALIIFDRRTGRRYDVSDIGARLSSSEDGSAKARIDLRTGGAPWSAHLEISPRSAEGQGFSARSENLTLGELLSLAGFRGQGVDGSAKTTLVLSANVDAGLKARSVRAEISFGATRLLTALPEAEQIALEQGALALVWTDGADRIAVETARFRAGGADVTLKGEAAPPHQPGDPWRIAVGGANLRAPGVAKGDKAVDLALAAFEVAAWPAEGRYELTKAHVAGPLAQVGMTGRLTVNSDGQPALDLELDAHESDARAALRLWPHFAAPEVRTWLIENLPAGTLNQLKLKLNFPPQVLEAALSDQPIPESSLAVNWNVSRAVLQPVPGSPPIRDAVASGTVTGRTARVELNSGVVDVSPGKRLTVSEGSFVIADTARHPPDARVRLRFAGGADALAEMLATPGLRAHSPAPVDAPGLKGTVDGEAVINLRLVPKMSPNDVRVAVNAGFRGMTLEKAIAGEKIEAGNFQLQADRQNLQIKGEARVFGVAANIELRASGKAKPRAVLAMTMDDAARNRAGLNLGSFLTGPVGIKIATDLDAPDDRDIAVEADLARAKLEGLIPGWLKPVGQPARAKATVSATEGGGWQLDDIEFDAGSLSVRGSATLAKDGQLLKAQLPVFKISAGDNARLDIDRAGGALRLNVRGNSIDARLFLKSLQTGAIDKAGAKDTEINLKSTVLSGFNGEIVANADLKLLMRGSELRRFDLTGAFDRGPIATKLALKAGSPPTLTVDTQDAGAFLRFFDIYNRMQGGHLTLGASLGTGSQTGTLLVREFVLRNEPAMKRLVADAASQAIQGDSVRIDPAFVQRLSQNQDVRFNKMTVEFQRNVSRLNIKDAVIWGPEIGGSMAGILDYGRDRVELTGTFVPAYGLNNLFSQVPLFGPILGGGQNEGLFAIRYSIIGRVSAPTLTVNPLTAIAPGFLRRLIDFRGAPGSNVPRPLPSGSDR